MRCHHALFFLLIGLLTASAQNRPFETVPELSLCFPMEENADGVVLKSAVLINDIAIIPAKAILRVIYVTPRVDDDRMRAIRSRTGSDASWSRDNRLSEKDKLTPSQIAMLEVSRNTVWPSTTNFQLALANLGADDIRIVYIVPGSTPEDFKFYDQRLVFPEGLVLTEANRAVTVLAVEKTKAGERAGIKAGDIITQVGDKPTNGSLAVFLDNYHAVKKATETAMKTTFPMTVKAADGTERVATIKLPPSIGTGFLDSPIIDSSATKTKSSTTNAPSLTVPEVWEKKKPTAPAAPNP